MTSAAAAAAGCACQASVCVCVCVLVCEGRGGWVFRKTLKRSHRGLSQEGLKSEVAPSGPSPAAPESKLVAPQFPLKWAARTAAHPRALPLPLAPLRPLQRYTGGRPRTGSQKRRSRQRKRRVFLASLLSGGLSVCPVLSVCPSLASGLPPPLFPSSPLLFICNANRSYSLVLVLIGLRGGGC